MKIRNVKLEEAEIVHEILLENGRWMLKNGIEQWPMDWLVSIKDEIAQSVSVGNFLCCESRDRIGAIVEVKRDAEALWGLDRQKSAYLHKLATSRSNYQRGLGSLLLRHILNQARSEGLDFLRLDCIATNERLRDYYQGHGYSLVAIKSNGVVDLALYQKSVFAS